MTLTFTLIYTDDASREGRASFTCGLDSVPDSVNFDGVAQLILERRTEAGLSALRPVIVPARDLAASRLEITVPVIREGDDALFYIAGNNTNAFAGIEIFDGKRYEEYLSRDVFLAENRTAGKKINLAFCSFDKLFTRFASRGCCETAVMELENKVIPGGTYFTTEFFAADEARSGAAFFEAYTQFLKRYYRVGKMKPRQKGWSSWSCLYDQVTEEAVLKQAGLVRKYLGDLDADLIQIDDGWQKAGSFGAYWTDNTEAFPSGQKAVSEKVKGNGQRYGLWLAPGIVSDYSPRFEELYPLLLKVKPVEEGVIDYTAIKQSFGVDEESADKGKCHAYYPMDLSREDVRELLVSAFRRCVRTYGSDYFKIDFLTNLIFRVGFPAPVVFPGGYAVETYKKLISAIRRTVGRKRFLLSCGAPIGESVGIFDGMRASPDISWGGFGEPSHPGYYYIIKKDIQNIILRSPYHNRVLINDPDALLVRDYLTSHTEDGFCLTDNEAVQWATCVLTSGGHILVNEELDKLPPKRLKLVRKTFALAKEFGEMGFGSSAARPLDFFEYPFCTESFLPFSLKRTKTPEALCDAFGKGQKLNPKTCGAVICLYQYEDRAVKKTVDLGKIFNCGPDTEFVMKDVWTGKETVVRGKTELTVGAHGARCCLVKKV